MKIRGYIKAVVDALFPNGAKMIINCTYNKQNGTLTSKHKYSIAQYNNLADTINIKCVGMTDPTAYGYYIDFVCYSQRGAAKGVFTSPKMEYGDNGLDFVIPNCLTQYVGYVQAQLIIYDKIDNNIIAKSVEKKTELFEVVASANALETQVLDTPNMMTELERAVVKAGELQQDMQESIDYAYSIEGKLEEKFTTQVIDEIQRVMSVYKMIKVYYCFYNEIVKTEWVFPGGKLSGYEKDLTNNVLKHDGWYCPAKNKMWNFETDTVDDDGELYIYANCYSIPSRVDNGSFIVEECYNNIYLPYEVNGAKVSYYKTSESVYSVNNLYVSDISWSFYGMCAENYIVNLKSSKYIGGKSLYSINEDLILPSYRQGGSIFYYESKGTIQQWNNLGEAYWIYINGFVKEIPYRCFAEKQYLQNVVINGDVEDLNHDIFYGSDNVKSLAIISNIPPSKRSQSLPTREDFCVYVPDMMVNTYKTHYSWQDMADRIKPLSEFTYTLPDIYG